MMKQPILKSRLSTLIDFSLTQYDLGLPTESEATGIENLEQPQIDDSKIINEIVREIFPEGIDNFGDSHKDVIHIMMTVSVRLVTDNSLSQKLLSVSSEESIKTGNKAIDIALQTHYCNNQ